MPAGLKVSTDTITADLRSDPALTFDLMKSTDLMSWTPANLPMAKGSGAAAGFERLIWTEPTSDSKMLFYRIQLRR